MHAESLLAAYRSKEAMDPLPPLTVQGAYEIQREQVRAWMAEGAVVKGHKVGLTSAAMRRQMGVDDSDYGHLMDFMFFEGEVDTGRFLQPRVEPEIGFILGAPLRGPDVTLQEASAAVAAVIPALEIIDSRIRDWKITLSDTIADNASSGGVVLGPQRVPLPGLDVTAIECTLTINGTEVDSGRGEAVLGSPLNALVWLANTVGPLGVTLEAGHVVLPGSLTASHPVLAGDVVSVEFGGLGKVEASFT